MTVNRKTFGLKTATSSDATISLYPTWGYTERQNKNKSFKRTQGQQLNAFSTVGGYTEYSLPLDYIGSSDAHTINIWWANQTQLSFLFNKNISGEASTVVVKVENQIKPFNQNVPGKFSSFMGTLILATVDNSTPVYPQFFTLDDPVLGVLGANILAGE